MTKICKRCERDFEPSSRHRLCPKCRNEVERKPCPDCGTLIQIVSKRCASCAAKASAGDGRGKDKYYEIRLHLARAKKRGKLGNLTLDDLLQKWEQQQGICVYTKIKLQVPSQQCKNDPVTTASLDRINSSLPYEKGNIQFISVSANYMKGELSHERMLEFCQIIANAWYEKH